MDRDRLAFVGAYERDNFGDILFPWVTRRLLSEKAGVHHLAAFDGRVDDLVEANVRAYTDFLRSEVPISGLWSVGGEIGGLDGPGALRFVSSDPGEQERASAGEMPFAYLPQPSRFLTSLGCPWVINSAGFHGVDHMSNARKLQLRQLLREADFISVRENRSSRNLSSLGIQHAVAPDVVSVISRLHPGLPSRNYLALHANENLLTEGSFEALAKSLRASGVVPGMKVVIFAAGMALGHDSMHSLMQLAEAIKDEERGADVVLMKDRRPLAIVDLISGARLVVSTSLHARIVAASYGVPRVSLENSKVSTYAESWDQGWPHGVELHQVREVLEALSSSSPDPQHGSALAQLAEDNCMLAQAALVAGDARTRAARRLERGAKNTQEWQEYSSKIAERLRWAERGVLPYRTLAYGTLRRAIKGKGPSASYGEPI